MVGVRSGLEEEIGDRSGEVAARKLAWKGRRGVHEQLCLRWKRLRLFGTTESRAFFLGSEPKNHITPLGMTCRTYLLLKERGF